MHNLKIILLGLSLSSLSFGAVGKEKLTLSSFIIPHYVTSDKTGRFVLLAQKLAEISGYELTIKIYPTKRALQKFAEGSVAGYFPALDRINPKDVSKTSDFYIKEDFLFERVSPQSKNSKLPKICLTTGYSYTKDVIENKEWEIVFSKSDRKCLERLTIGRVQGFVGEEVSTLEAIREMKLENKVKYNKFKPLSSQGVYFAFSNTEGGKIIGQKFNEALKIIVRDGRFDILFPEKKR